MIVELADCIKRTRVTKNGTYFELQTSEGILEFYVSDVGAMLITDHGGKRIDGNTFTVCQLETTIRILSRIKAYVENPSSVATTKTHAPQ